MSALLYILLGALIGFAICGCYHETDGK